MGDITMAQIYQFILALSAFIGASTAIAAFSIKAFRKTIRPFVDEALKPIADDIKNIKEDMSAQKESIEELQISQYKDYIVNFVNDVRNDEPVDVSQIKRYYEARDKYYEAGYNSYIHAACDTIDEKVKKIMDTNG